MTALAAFLAGRTGRERMLFTLLVLIVLPLGIGLGLLMPLREARSAARATQAEAQAVQAWVAARVVEKPGPGTLAEGVRPPPMGSAQVEQSLIDAGLRADISQLGEGEGGVVTLLFEEVTFTTLANWISAQEPRWGYGLGSFAFEATDRSGKVRASLTLTPLDPA